ncbi:MAG: 4Fe-4S binding protein [Bacteroidales bacterium]|nr:4Fe-4S binding protein [Bacteroidales bacterium]MCL2133263.1 4Fe-4S binding protein [Bacteroidales bacterium]
MKKINNFWKNLLQWGVIAAILTFIITGLITGNKADVEAYCPFGGLQAFSTYLVNGTLACSMSMVQIMIGIVLAVGVILFSKLFCGYLCPLGTLSEAMGKLRKKIKIKEIVIPSGSIADKALRIIKYALLFIVFYFTLSSSELFCKNFDPYYAMATGFKGEITAWMSLTTVILLFCGSFFISMFWCRYICPLGAISHIFKFTLWFVAFILLFVLLGFLGLHIPLTWILAIACITFYGLEIIVGKTKYLPVLNITRDTKTCNNCGICAKKCPYRIDVDKLEVVRHIDCTLCGECINSCAQKSLQVNRSKKFRWFPTIIVLVLFAAALWLGGNWELATIDERWGELPTDAQLETVEMSGLRSVKCYGSSKAFSAQMQKVSGVYGVATYVRAHRVKIYYNPAETNEDNIATAVFTPFVSKLNALPADISVLNIVTLGVDKLFDRMDANYLGQLFRQHEGFYGIETEYACPVIVRLYVDPNTDVSEKRLRTIVERKILLMPTHGGGETTIKCNYQLVTLDAAIGTVSRELFVQQFFRGVSYPYKKNMEKHEGEPTGIYELTYPGLEKPIVTRALPFLSNHLSQKSGILKFETVLNEEEEAVIQITFVKGVADADKIWEYLTAPKWHIRKSDGTEEDQDPKLVFETEGKVIE